MTDDVVSKNIVTDLVHLTILEFMDICADSEEVPMTEKDELLLEINKKIGTRIKELPSAQSEVAKDTNVPSNDCISRQSAIDAMANAIWHYPNELYRGLNQYETARELAKIGLSSLPSAQPERIRCKDCLMHGVCRFEQGLGLNGYCSQAKRREDE